ncbi:MAG: cytochrome c [Verrucomicrobiales bacterium]|nr:cytochrome c [Verrucomicrobiales bacterium]
MKFTLHFYLALTLSLFTGFAEEKQSKAEHSPPAAQIDLPADISADDLFAKVCSNCHGKKGEGSATLKAPSIAGLPSWYVTTQIEKFRSDLRGISAEDPAGQIMHNIITAIDARQTAGLSKLIAAMPMHPTQNQLGGDANKGKEVFMTVCAKCHRFNGKGEIVFGSAPLIGLQDWYIRAQIYKFRKGIRGGNPADEKGHKMHQMTQYITDEQAANVTAHIAVLAKKYANTLSRRDQEFEEMRKRKEKKKLNQNALPEELRE